MNYRLQPQPYEVIDRSRKIDFNWDGASLSGFGGDTLAAALLATGAKVCNYSFKYGKPRGIYAAWADEPNAIVTLEESNYRVPNARATEVELYENLIAESTGGKLKGLMRFMHGMMPAGFYYKTFQQPQLLWPWYEKIIRRLAGLSPAPSYPDAECYDHQHQHCDLLIVGGGVAGLRVAELMAQDETRRIMLIDDRPHLGGQWFMDAAAQIDGKPLPAWIRETEARLSKRIAILKRTTVYGLYEGNLALALERLQDHLPLSERRDQLPRQRQHKIRARQVLLATGSYERPIIFPANDLPGVMLAGAVQSFIHCYGVLPSRTPLVYTNNDSAYQLAEDMLAAGVSKVQVVDTRAEGEERKGREGKGIEVFAGYELLSSHGNRKVTGATIRSIKDGSQRRLPLDLIAIAGGFDPAVHLSCHSGGKPRWSDESCCFLPVDCLCAGAVDGYHSAASAYENATAVAQQLRGWITEASPPRPHFNISLKLWTESKAGEELPKQFVDMQNDVTKSDIELAIRENYKSIEHIKRYTVMGFGTDQGKSSNVLGIQIAAHLLGLPINQVGTTTYRPPYTPVTFGAIVGTHRRELYDARRHTPMHFSHLERTDEWEVVGQWMRPWYYPRQAEDMQTAVSREALAARKGLAMMDVSTLGKIDVQGADAREFLNRIYTNAWSKLALGKCRYGIMLTEDGMVFDDGVTCCIDENRFLMTTTTGGAAGVYSWLEGWLQTEWPHLKVYLTSVTDHWATIAVIGPQSRALMRKLCNDVDFSADSFGFMEWKPGTVCGLPARIMRISFTGELSYEINVQANYGRYLWEQVYEAGREFDITQYGTETMHLLRAEKGFVIVGQDTDGTMTPLDLDLEWILGKKKNVSYIGDRSLTREAMKKDDRLQLVGLLTQDKKTRLSEGCALVDEKGKENNGFVSSSYYSPVLERPIALALVKGGIKRKGQIIYARERGQNQLIKADITDYVFYDPKGERRDG